MPPLSRVAALLLALLLGGGCASGRRDALVHTPPVRHDYLDLVSTHAVHAKTLWHAADVGGYWGDGVDPNADQNGATRGTCNTMLAYAALVVAGDRGWLPADVAARLKEA